MLNVFDINRQVGARQGRGARDPPRQRAVDRPWGTITVPGMPATAALDDASVPVTPPPGRDADSVPIAKRQQSTRIAIRVDGIDGVSAFF
jgi:hypothetical protein